MATAFAGANGTVLHNHSHDHHDPDHDHHVQRHDPRPQYRRATSSQESQNSLAATLNRTRSQGDGRVFASIQEEAGFQSQSRAYSSGGNSFSHKHTPSLQLNGNLGPQLSDPSWKGELAFSPPPVTPDIRSGASTSFPGLDGTIHSHSHAYTHSTSHKPLNSQANENMTAHDLSHMVGNEVSQLSRAYLSKTEFFASILISLPFAFTASLVRRHADDAEVTSLTSNAKSLSVFEISTIVSITLLIVGLIGKLDRSEQAATHDSSLNSFTILFSQRRNLETLFATVLSVALPFYSISNLGSVRVTAFILSAIVTGSLHVSDAHGNPKRAVLTKTLRQHKFLSGALTLQALVDFAGYTSKTSAVSLASGYLALVLSMAYFPLPFPTFKREAPSKMDARSPTTFEFSKASHLFLSPVNANLALAGSLLTSAAAIILLSLSPSDNSRAVTKIVFQDCWTISLPLAVSLSYTYPPWLISRYKVGYAIALACPVSINYLLALSDLQSTIMQSALMSLSFIATIFDGRLVADANQFHRKRGNSALTPHQHSHGQPTAISRYLIAKTIDWPILHSILAEDDSRPVFYFMLLNLTFMGIQAFYSIVTESLGLLSDSIHMFFDCFALAVGLAAAVMSKWPPSARFPYGYGMLNVLAGFGNGVFLMLISIEIVYEAFERLVEGVEMNRLKELFVVSVLGMLVNLVGLVAMPHHHHHHGHDHGHGHGHSHSHSHSHGNGHDHAHGSDCHGHGHDHNHDHDHDHDHGHGNGHLHSHSSVENFRHQRLQSQASNASLASPRIPKPSPLGSIDINTPQHLAPQHAHTHSHSPSLRHQPSQSSLQHSHSPSIPHTHDHSHSHSHSHSHGHSHGGGHSHDHMNENMMGIWLHIAADALGSLSVVISTVLIHFSGRSFWDPLASILIALLIFASAVPLVRSCATRLLLTNPAGLEFDLKDALQSVSALRGVDGVCVPKFWSVEGEGEGSTVTHGVLHVIANPRDSLEEVRERVELEFRRREMQVLVQVERESEGRCWCGGGRYKM